MLSFISNRRRSHLEVLSELFESATFARLAVAYIKMSGLSALEQANAEITKHGGQLRVITTSDFQLTEGEALHRLYTAGAVIKLYVTSQSTFHPKFYLISRPASRQFDLLVGSANLTGGGLRDNVEASMLLSADANHPAIREAYRFFRRLWHHDGSILIDDDYIAQYRRAESAFRDTRREATLAAAKVVRELNQHYQARSRKRRRAQPRRIIDMCIVVMTPGETLHYREVTARIQNRFPDREFGRTPNASVRRTLNHWSDRHPNKNQNIFHAEESGRYTLLPS